MATDLNDLNLDMEVGVAFDEYEKPTNSFRPVEPKQEYSMVRDPDEPLDWQRTKTGDIWTPVRFRVQGGPNHGRIIFETLSTYISKFRKASSAQDFLAACGFDEEPENGRRFTVREIIDAVNKTYGPFEAYVDWTGYCSNCKKTTIKSSDGFPRNDDGELLSEAECPKCGELVTARARVKRFVVS